MSTHLGTENFLEVPTVNGVNVLTAATGVLAGPGQVLQLVTGSIPALLTTVQVPWDNTVPLSTEGAQIWTQAFTPLSATSRIIVQSTITVAHSTASRVVTQSIFAGTTNIGAMGTTMVAIANSPACSALTIVHAPLSTAAITFSARVGANGTNTTFVNQAGAAQAAGGTLGGAIVTEYIIMEIE